MAGAIDMLAINMNDPLTLTTPNPILSDLAVRRAMILGFNRQKVVDEFLAGQTSVATTPLDNTRWLAPDLKPYSYDPADARRALDVAGWRTQSDGVRAKNGVRLSFTLIGIQGDSADAVLEQRIEKAFVSDMAAIGIQVEQRSVSTDELNADIKSGGILANRAFDVVNLPNNARGGPARFAARFSSHNIASTLNPAGSNVMGYSSVVVDAAIEGESRAVDQQSRAELLYAAQRTIFTDLPVIPVYDHFQVDASRSYVNGLKPGPVSGLWWDTEDWWVKRQDASP